MSRNSSNTPVVEVVQQTPPQPTKRQRILYSIGLPLWVFFGFMLAQALLLAALTGLQAANITIGGLDTPTFNTVISVIVYGLAISLVIGVPWLIKRRPTTLKDLGIHRLPTWMDVLWAPAGLVAYLIATSVIMALAMAFVTFVDYNQSQETGFAQLEYTWQYALAFISLVVVAPVAEEILFRGYLLGKLRKYAPLWVAILVTSLMFAIVHFQWNVGFDVFALSIVLCVLRVVSGSLWPAILLHMMKNGVAYYFLFINPSLLSTLGG